MEFPSTYRMLEPQEEVGHYSKALANQFGDKTATIEISNDRQFSYLELAERVNKLSNYLVDIHGVKKGDVVLTLDVLNMTMLELFLACSQIGAIFVSGGLWQKLEQLESFIENTSPKLTIIKPPHEQETEETKNTRTKIEQLVSSLIVWTEETDEHVSSLSEKFSTTTRHKLEDPALYTFTSGTTGIPKVCVITHRQLIWNAFEVLCLGEKAFGGRVFAGYPFISFVGFYRVLTALFSGNGVVLGMYAPNLNYESIIADNGITAQATNPSFGKAMIRSNEFNNSSLSPLKHIWFAGGDTEDSILRAFWEKNIFASKAYGMSEAGLVSLYPDLKQDKATLMRDATSVGWSALFVDLEVVNYDGTPCNDGIVKLRSPHAFHGYLNDRETNGRIFKDGWLVTHDQAVIDPSKLLRIIGRLEKDHPNDNIHTKNPDWTPLNYDTIPYQWIKELPTKRATLSADDIFIESNGSRVTYGEFAKLESVDEVTTLFKAMAGVSSIDLETTALTKAQQAGLNTTLINTNQGEYSVGDVIWKALLRLQQHGWQSPLSASIKGIKSLNDAVTAVAVLLSGGQLAVN